MRGSTSNVVVTPTGRQRLSRAFGALVLLACVGAFASCNAITGIGGYSHEDCGACIRRACAAVTNECNGLAVSQCGENPADILACKDGYQFILTCLRPNDSGAPSNVATCSDELAKQHPQEAASCRGQAVVLCIESECPDTCGFTTTPVEPVDGSVGETSADAIPSEGGGDTSGETNADAPSDR